ncbi:TPA: oligosaccharide flippase family protein [Vibrio vulnificus]|nr:oligosaccharide flippase family protein [Vibrio vulnificus]
MNIIKSFIWMLSEHGVVLVSNLATNVFLARLLQPENYGALSFSLSFSLLFLPIFQMGLNTIVTKDIIDKDCGKSVIYNSLIIRITGSIGGFFIAYIILAFQGYTDDIKLFVLILLLGQFFLSFSVVEFWYHAKYKAKIFSSTRSVIIFIFSIIKVAFAYIGLDVFYIIILFALENMAFSLISFFLFNKLTINERRFTVNKKYCFDLISRSKWLVFSAFASMIYLKIDQVMIGNYLGNVEVAKYAVASKISEVWYFLPAVFVNAFFPKLVEIKNESKEKYRLVSNGIISLLFYCGAIIAVIIYFISQEIIIVLFGYDYIESVKVLQIHIWACLFIFMRSLVSKILIAEELYYMSLWSHGVGAIVNVILNFYLIPKFGIYGAAYATIVSYFIASVFVFLFNNSTRWIFYAMIKCFYGFIVLRKL